MCQQSMNLSFKYGFVGKRINDKIRIDKIGHKNERRGKGDKLKVRTSIVCESIVRGRVE